MILGLTGSIGSGKTFVVNCLEQLGAVAVRADELAREVVAPGTPGFTEIIEQFGPGVLAGDGSLDRRKLARIVFSDSSKRQRLEQIVHPRVRARELEIIARNRNHPLIVLDIPLLFETGAEEICDAVLVVTLDDAKRRERLKRDRGMSDAEIDARLAVQMPEQEKVRRADHVIDNSSDRESTRRAVIELVEKLVGRPDLFHP